jgi:acyl carrier protein phosphodiesterase
MNFLAHAYLSFEEPEILVGNMISDFVKGRKKLDYPEAVQKGIILHRAIDTFTDDHPSTKEAKQFFKEAVGLYSGAFVDVAYDHFLANDENQFTEAALKDFCSRTYKVLRDHQSILPPRFLQMLPFMISQNWLYNYRNLWGAENSFAGLARRAKYLDSSGLAFAALKEHYTSLQKCYNDFFPVVKQFASEYMRALYT